MARGRGEARTRSGMPPTTEVPDKLYFRIGEVARLLNLPTYVLRFWETEFPNLRPTKGSTGQRLYRHRDVEALQQIRRLLYDEGYTIPGARRWLQDRNEALAPATIAEPARPTPQESNTVRDAALQQVHILLRELSRALSGPPQEHSTANLPAPLAAARKRQAGQNDAPTLFALGDDEAKTSAE